MHTSLMRRYGAPLEVALDNMGYAGSTGSIALDVYSKTWWCERVEAVSRLGGAGAEQMLRATIETGIRMGTIRPAQNMPTNRNQFHGISAVRTS